MMNISFISNNNNKNFTFIVSNGCAANNVKMLAVDAQLKSYKMLFIYLYIFYKVHLLINSFLKLNIISIFLIIINK
jgi:hypothetical protein